MPAQRKLLTTLVFIFVLMMGNSFRNDEAALPDTLLGAWQLQNSDGEQVIILIDDYITHTSYNQQQKKFIYTRGGTCRAADGKLTVGFEFSTNNKEEVGSSKPFEFSFNNGALTTTVSGKKETWKRLDDGKGPLAGNWQITGRMQGDKMNEMRPGARKTIKILSGTRFQWAAINTETKEFFGTGGGNYTFSNGKYTEKIEFFSRDSSRVGASLSFDGSVENGKWIHKGLSSRGASIHEVWSRPSLSR